jgi:putative Mg2+ transporter-C (MgtC) family protein
VVGEPEAILRIAMAAAFGALIGLDREARHKPAGLRTYSIVAMGSAFFSLVGLVTFGENDAGARIAAQVVTGVGFLGAGTILHYRGNVVGLTTAAGIWGAAAIGMGFGFGLYFLSIGGAIVMLAILRIFGEVVTGAREPHDTPDDEDD